MHFGKAAFLNESQGLDKFLLRLAGKAHDHVGGDGGAVKVPVQQGHGFQISGGVVFPVHTLERFVAAGLHGQVELRTKARQRRRTAAEVLRDGSGLQTAQPQPQLRRGGAERLHQVDKALAVFEIVPPRGDFDAGQNDLPIARRRQFPGPFHRCLQRQGTNGAPGIGDDAVRTEVDAPILHLQHGAGAALQPSRRENLKAPAVKGSVHGFHGPAILQLQLQKIEKAHPVAGSRDQVHVQLPHILRMSLGIASAHSHHCLRMFPPGAGKHLAGFLVADGGDRAGVDHIGIRAVGKGHDLVAPAAQFLFHGLGFVLIDFAAQRVNGDFHGFSLLF